MQKSQNAPTILLGLAAIAAATLITEIALTKFISYKLFYHYTYAIVSLVMFSFGLAGVSVFVKPQQYGSDQPEHWWRAAQQAWGFSCTLPAAIALFCLLPVENYTHYLPEPMRVAMYVLCGVSFALPFYHAGMTISQVFAAGAVKATTIYAVDLLAAAGGALLTPMLLEQVGGYGTMMIAACLGALSAVLIGRAGGASAPRFPVKYIAVFSLSCLLMFVAPRLCLEYFGFDILSLKDPGLGNLFSRFGGLGHTYWNAVARIDVSKTSDSKYGGLTYGMSPKVPRGGLRGRYILVDGCANTRQIIMNTEQQRQLCLETNMFAAPYVVHGQTENAMIIGGGGGIDVEIAKLFKIPHIDVVEMNPSMYRLLTGKADDAEAGVYVPPLLSDSGSTVNATFDEARHFCSRSKPGSYDVIHAGGVDTLAAIASGGMSLVENYLYTQDAVRIYYRMLKPGGVLSLSHLRRIPPHIGLRMFNTYLSALESEGVREPWRQVMSIGGDWTVNLLKKGPFTTEETARLSKWAVENGYTVLFDPSHPEQISADPHEGIFQQVAVASPEERRTIEKQFIYDVAPVTDDKPYFYRTVKGFFDREAAHVQEQAHYYLIVVAAFGVLLLALLPMIRVRERKTRQLFWRYGPFFSLSGFAFLLFETSTIQLLGIFVGGPLYSLAVTLVAVLGGYGLGSFLCRDWRKDSRYFIIVGLAIVALLVLSFAFMAPLIAQLMPLDNWQRLLAAVAITLVLSIPVGMLVPAGADLVREDDHSALAWMWGINSGFNVLGGVSYVAISQTIGIRATFLVVGVLYLLASAWMILALRRSKTAGEV